MKKLNKQVVCKDGFKMSVQASRISYCSPMTDYCDKYTEVEVGFPSAKESLLMPYAENTEDPTNTVYPYVPVSIVSLVLVKHGGIVSGYVPPGVPDLREQR
jgi:hypothetical protein